VTEYDEFLTLQDAQAPPEVTASRRLLAAVLHRAILDYANARALDIPYKTLYMTEWFDSDVAHASAEEGLSFVWICDHLGLEHTHVRRKVYENWRVVAHSELAAQERKALRKAKENGNEHESEAGLPEAVQRPPRRDRTTLDEEQGTALV
jgi:hypothetical protein